MYSKNFPFKRYQITTDFIKKHVDKNELILDLGIKNPLSKILKNNQLKLQQAFEKLAENKLYNYADFSFFSGADFSSLLFNSFTPPFIEHVALKVAPGSTESLAISTSPSI